MSKIGYIRVSTESQETARQEALMFELGVDKVFSEKISGKSADRPQLRAMLNYVRDGDILVFESISRLSRSTKDLLNIIDELEMKNVKFVSQKEQWDTSTAQGRFVLQIFAALAELERAQTLQRQKEGIAIAKSRGIYTGRKFKKIDEVQFVKLYNRWRSHEITAVDFAKKVDLKPNAFYRRVKRYESVGKIN